MDNKDSFDTKLLSVSTLMFRNYDDPEVIEFSVQCCYEHELGEEKSNPILLQPAATLKGFLYEPGYYPNANDTAYLDVFDERTQHSADALHMLTSDSKLVLDSLRVSPAMEGDVYGVAHLEDAWVDPEFRGQGLALRLMREARHILNRHGLLVVLKAHPGKEDDDVTDEQCIKLAKYYQSDKVLEFVAVDEEAHPGWLVSMWSEVRFSPSDERIWKPRSK